MDLGCQDDLKGLYGRGPQAERLRRLQKTHRVISEAQIQEEAAKILDTDPYRNEVFRNWRQHAGDLKTVIFCTTVDHALNVCHTFQQRGVNATVLHSAMSMQERTARLQSFESGKDQVIVNVMILTEGWDCPAVECVVLLRPSSYKSTMIQMVGRGLRPYPGKTECKILDFGMSSVIHGSLEQDIELTKSKGTKQLKECPECQQIIPRNAKECPQCGYLFQYKKRKKPPADVPLDILLNMGEMNLIDTSPFRWVYWHKEKALIATSIDACVMLIQRSTKKFDLYGNLKGEAPKLLATESRHACLRMGDKFLKKHSRGTWAHKNASWLRDDPTERQVNFLRTQGHQPKDKYEATAIISYYINRKHIPTLTPYR